MPAKKTKAGPIGPVPDRETVADTIFPHAVEAPYLAGWEHALTEKCGMRGKSWTSTKSEPQWTVRFKDLATAAWFKDTWTAEVR